MPDPAGLRPGLTFSALPSLSAGKRLFGMSGHGGGNFRRIDGTFPLLRSLSQLH